MDRIQQVAQLLVSSWSVTASAEGDRAIPTSHGIFDRALKEVADAGGLPAWATESLHFVDSRIGLQCVELPMIWDWAQKAELTAVPNPSYRLTQVQISDTAAKKIIRRLEMGENAAISLGRALRDAVSTAKEHASTSQVFDDY